MLALSGRRDVAAAGGGCSGQGESTRRLKAVLTNYLQVPPHHSEEATQAIRARQELQSCLGVHSMERWAPSRRVDVASKGQLGELKCEVGLPL